MTTVAHDASRVGASAAVGTAKWVRALPLVGLVAAGFVARAAMGRLRPTVAYFPDEYIYGEISRSLAETGKPAVRGGSAHFPALLEPILTAPAWLAADVLTSFRLVQTIGALLMALAAVPIYLLARRLGITRPVALTVAALTLTFPELLYAGWVLSEPVAYPLVLAAVAAGTVALARPSRRAQIAFLACAGLATFARAQLAIVLLAFVAAAIVIGARERGLRRVLREQRLPLGSIGGLAVLVIVAGPGVLGIYTAALHPAQGARGVLGNVGANALVLAYASGWVLVPGAILGLAFGLARPRSRVELAFAALTSVLAGGLLLQAAVWGSSEQVQERYLFYLLPLAATAFGLFAARQWPARRAHALIAAVFVLVTAFVPLSAFTVSSDHSPFLFATLQVERLVGETADASLIVALSACLLLLAAVAASARPRIGTPVVLALAIGATASASAGAGAFDAATTRSMVEDFLPNGRSWVDRAHAGPVTLVRTTRIASHNGLEQMFWNRSIVRVLHLPGASRLDAFATDWIQVGADGRLSVRGKPVAEALLVDENTATVRLRATSVLARTPRYSLWRASQGARLAQALTGRYWDGWLAPRGTLDLWPRRAGESIRGRLTLRLRLPSGRAPVTIRFRTSGTTVAAVRVAAGTSPLVRLNVCSRSRAQISFRASTFVLLDRRTVSVRSSVPLFRSDPSACA